MTLNTALRALRAHLIAVVVFTGAGLATAALVFALLPRTYEATAQIWVRSEPAADASPLMPSVLEFARSHTVSDAAAQKLGGGTSPDDVESATELAVPTGSSIITVTSTAGTPDRAADTARAVTDGLGETLAHTNPTKGHLSLVTTQQAQSDGEATSPQPLVVLTAGLLIGLAAGVLWAVWRGPQPTGEGASGADTGDDS